MKSIAVSYINITKHKKELYIGKKIPCINNYSRFKLHSTLIILLRLTGECKTAGGKFPKLPCIFPFQFEEKTYNTCISVNNSLPGCPTRKKFIVDSKPYYWGNCGPGCPGSLGEPIGNAYTIEKASSN